MKKICKINFHVFKNTPEIRLLYSKTVHPKLEVQRVSVTYGQLGLVEVLLSDYSLKTQYFSLFKTGKLTGSVPNQLPILNRRLTGHRASQFACFKQSYFPRGKEAMT